MPLIERISPVGEKMNESSTAHRSDLAALCCVSPDWLVKSFKVWGSTALTFNVYEQVMRPAQLALGCLDFLLMQICNKDLHSPVSLSLLYRRSL